MDHRSRGQAPFLTRNLSEFEWCCHGLDLVAWGGTLGEQVLWVLAE